MALPISSGAKRRAPFGRRLLDGDERYGEGLVGGGHLDDGDEQPGSGPEVGGRADARQLEDLRPEVGVLQVALGDAAKRVAVLQDDRLERPVDRRGAGHGPGEGADERPCDDPPQELIFPPRASAVTFQEATRNLP